MNFYNSSIDKSARCCYVDASLSTTLASQPLHVRSVQILPFHHPL
jgi:hypothetical protein